MSMELVDMEELVDMMEEVVDMSIIQDGVLQDCILLLCFFYIDIKYLATY